MNSKQAVWEKKEEHMTSKLCTFFLRHSRLQTEAVQRTQCNWSIKAINQIQWILCLHANVSFFIVIWKITRRSFSHICYTFRYHFVWPQWPETLFQIHNTFKSIHNARAALISLFAAWIMIANLFIVDYIKINVQYRRKLTAMMLRANCEMCFHCRVWHILCLAKTCKVQTFMGFVYGLWTRNDDQYICYLNGEHKPNNK